MSKPDDSEQHCTTFDILFQPLEAPLEQQEQDHTPHHREVLHFAQFVRLLVYHFVKSCESGRQLLTDTLSAAPELELPMVKRSTFLDAFQRFPVAWFASLLSFLLAATVWKAIPELDALGKLYCIDGSVFPAIASISTLGDGSPVCESRRRYLRDIQCTFDCFDAHRHPHMRFFLPYKAHFRPHLGGIAKRLRASLE